MPKVKDILRWLDRFAPLATAESWDNVGLLLGDPDAPVARAMTCLTVTPAVVEEAESKRADMILSHHPILFRPAKSIRADRHEDAVVWRLARAGVSVLSPHTAFDNAADGINQLIATKLGLERTEPLRRSAAPTGSTEFKVVVFVPESVRAAVLDAAFATGAGRIGEYSECSFSAPGEGTFFGSERSNPTVGAAGRRESVAEIKAEFVCPASRLAAVLAAVREAHSYEEPAIDVMPLAKNRVEFEGSGRVGDLPGPEPLDELAARLASALGGESVQVVGEAARPVGRVAICCGAGDDFLPDARRAGADALVTGEARFHRALEAESTGVGLILLGHHTSERPGVEHLADRLAEAFSDVQVWASTRERDPIRCLTIPKKNPR